MKKIFKDYYCFILPVVFTGVKLLTDIEAGMTVAVILSAYIFASMLFYVLRGAQNIYFGIIPGSAALAFIFLPAFNVHIILLPLILMGIPAFMYRENNTFACYTAVVMLFLFVFVRNYFDLTVSLMYLISAIFVIITVIHNAIREKKSKDMEKQIEYYNAKKNIIDISPFALNKGEVLREDSPATLRIMNHISSAIETIIEIIARSVSVKSIIYIVYDRKEDKLFPEKAVSDEDVVLGRPLGDRDNALYWVIETGKDIKDNLYVGDPQKLGFYRKAVIVKSVIIVPVKLDDRITGLIYADSSSEKHFTDSDYQLINLSALEISRLLSFAKYAQNSKKDAAYFSILNDIVAKLAETLDFREIMDIAVETIHQIIDYDYCSVVQCSDRQYRIITQLPDGQFEDGELDQHSFISMLNTHSGLFIREKMLERDIPVYYLNKRNHDKKINAMIGFPFLSLDKSSVCLIAGIKGEFLFTKSVENVLKFLMNTIQTAAEKSQYYEKMKELAIKDGLTGVYNHRYFQEQLDFFIEQSGRSGRKMALAILDIDHFKQFNDEHGHQTGDEVLKFTAGMLADSVRASDFVARYGGEEFVIVFNNIKEDSIYQTTDKLREKVEKTGLFIPERGQKLFVTASFGLAVYSDVMDKNKLISLADNALYEAKRRGRNRTVLA